MVYVLFWMVYFLHKHVTSSEQVYCVWEEANSSPFFNGSTFMIFETELVIEPGACHFS